ncbi:hypothetical protein SAMN05444411_1161 [Lutibacter oricola]|uniref:Uncharacterized protein n=1 Tax=Lutibacter oricola TaxID=762486 RepID=A0A1H3GS89_9FLAO|nr:hypothetical protein [Lutibacter oricola]SDY05344.1 hypothetical protein SAMN05444411_1161 [Lutibacter oricola]
MTDKEINEFIKNSTIEDLKDYFNKLIERLNESSKRNDKLSLLMGILIVSYFIIDKNSVSNINLGIISINDMSIAKILIPLIFAFVLLIFATLNAHRAKITKNIKIIGQSLYNLKEDPLADSYYPNSFLRLIMPFSYLEELNSKYMKNGKFGCLTLFMTIPLYPIIALPFIFEFIALRKMILNDWSNGVFEKIITILTIWIILISIVYYIKLLSTSINENK